jgi:hypothetical protein
MQTTEKPLGSSRLTKYVIDTLTRQRYLTTQMLTSCQHSRQAVRAAMARLEDEGRIYHMTRRTVIGSMEVWALTGTVIPDFHGEETLSREQLVQLRLLNWFPGLTSTQLIRGRTVRKTYPEVKADLENLVERGLVERRPRDPGHPQIVTYWPAGASGRIDSQ